MVTKEDFEKVLNKYNIVRVEGNKILFADTQKENCYLALSGTKCYYLAGYIYYDIKYNEITYCGTLTYELDELNLKAFELHLATLYQQNTNAHLLQKLNLANINKQKMYADFVAL